MSLPALRTVRGGEARLRASDWWVVGLGTFAVPPLLGLLAGMVAPTVGTGMLAWAAWPLAVLGAQAAAPLATWALVPLGLMAGARALRAGWAGWAVAVAVPAALAAGAVAAYAPGSGYPPRTYAAPGAVFAASAALHGGVAWLLLRWRRPEALAPR